MSVTIPMDKAGRLVLPKPIRERFGMGDGGRLEVTVVGDHLELSPVKDHADAKAIERDGLLILTTGGMAFDAVEAIAEDREERMDYLRS
ncbi:hypothetical protein BH23VER1_BH23VER1_14730 [soil metagenome]